MAYIGPFRNKWRAQIQRNGVRSSKLFDTEEEAKAWADMKDRTLVSKGSHFIPTEKLSMTQSKLLSSIPSRVLNAIANVPYSMNEILDAAMPIGTAMGIYFLIKSNEVVYVGQSVDVYSRIAKHRSDGKDFDSFAFLQCERNMLNDLESLYISALVPFMNSALGAVRYRNRDAVLTGEISMASCGP